MTSNDNVIPFPSERIKVLPKTMEEVAEHLDFFRMTHVQDSLEAVIPTLFNQLSVLGFNGFDENDPIPERLGAMIVESIRAYLCYHHEIPHCFQDMATGMFACDSDGELILDGSLKVIFQKKDAPVPPTPKKRGRPKKEK
jgi:hypothetical protein